MRIPTMRGVIERRILVNYRVDADVLAAYLPAPFRPKLIHGLGIVGICLIRLKHVRPAWAPSWFGIASENAAHRFAVEWDDDGQRREGVYICRRDTSSRWNALAGGRVFPGVHHHARYTVRETLDRFAIDLRSDDNATEVSLRCRIARDLPPTSIFPSMDEASEFFRAGSLGYSATTDRARFQGLELRCREWRMEPLQVDEVRSSVFDDRSQFPAGSIELDCALLMRGIDHEWHGRADLCCDTAVDAARTGPTESAERRG